MYASALRTITIVLVPCPSNLHLKRSSGNLLQPCASCSPLAVFVSLHNPQSYWYVNITWKGRSVVVCSSSGTAAAVCLLSPTCERYHSDALGFSTSSPLQHLFSQVRAPLTLVPENCVACAFAAPWYCTLCELAGKCHRDMWILIPLVCSVLVVIIGGLVDGQLFAHEAVECRHPLIPGAPVACRGNLQMQSHSNRLPTALRRHIQQQRKALVFRQRNGLGLAQIALELCLWKQLVTCRIPDDDCQCMPTPCDPSIKCTAFPSSECTV